MRPPAARRAADTDELRICDDLSEAAAAQISRFRKGGLKGVIPWGFSNRFRPTPVPRSIHSMPAESFRKGLFSQEIETGFATWNFKATGSYDAGWGIRLSPVVRHQSGVNFARTLTVAVPAGSGLIASGG